VITGEQGAGKLARPVREGADGKDPRQGHLASGLLHSMGGRWKRSGTAHGDGLSPRRKPRDMAAGPTDRHRPRACALPDRDCRWIRPTRPMMSSPSGRCWTTSTHISRLPRASRRPSSDDPDSTHHDISAAASSSGAIDGSSLEPSRRNERPKASLEARCEAAIAGFDTSVQALMMKDDWLPTDSSPHGQAMTLRWQAGSRPSPLLHDDLFTCLAFRGLRQWRAFRGARGGVSLERFREVLAGIDGRLLDQMATINIVSLHPEVDGDQLLSIFRELEDVKPTKRKWVAASKVLYLLLPDLVVPMDGSTWRFLGRRTIPEGLREEDFRLAYSTFSRIAVEADREVEPLRDLAVPRPGTVRLGLGRVGDFAILGWMHDRWVSPSWTATSDLSG
jgi:hypothetical protein